MIFDIENIEGDLGRYEPENDSVKIFLAAIYNDFTRYNCILENRFIYDIIDTIVHEQLHQAIDECLDKPEDVDDHKVFKYLSFY